MKTPCLLPLFLAVVLFGCRPYTHFLPHQPAHSKMRSYVVGQLQKASVGDPIVTVHAAKGLPVYTAARDITPPDLGTITAMPLIPKGTPFVWIGDAVDGNMVLGGRAYDTSWGLHVTPEGVPAKGWIVAYYSATRSPGEHPKSASDWPSEQLFVRSPNDTLSVGSFKAELVYAGLSGSTLRTVYREYHDGFNSPAYTMDLQYNLDESRTIAYRTIRLEVIRATNQEIEYRVTSDGDLPWVQ
jgi:hypothetical protein